MLVLGSEGSLPRLEDVSPVLSIFGEVALGLWWEVPLKSVGAGVADGTVVTLAAGDAVVLAVADCTGANQLCIFPTGTVCIATFVDSVCGSATVETGPSSVAAGCRALGGSYSPRRSAEQLAQIGSRDCRTASETTTSGVYCCVRGQLLALQLLRNISLAQYGCDVKIL